MKKFFMASFAILMRNGSMLLCSAIFLFSCSKSTETPTENKIFIKLNVDGHIYEYTNDEVAGELFVSRDFSVGSISENVSNNPKERPSLFIGFVSNDAIRSQDSGVFWITGATYSPDRTEEHTLRASNTGNTDIEMQHVTISKINSERTEWSGDFVTTVSDITGVSKKVLTGTFSISR